MLGYTATGKALPTASASSEKTPLVLIPQDFQDRKTGYKVTRYDKVHLQAKGNHKHECTIEF